jgi:predicted nucleic acid-binding protein
MPEGAMRAIDTNVLVRLITRDEPRDATSADAFIADGAWVSVLALAEATWVLSTVYDLSPKKVAKAIEMLLNHRTLVLQDPETIAASLGRFRVKPALSFSDCLMLQLAREAGNLPLGTFDRNLAKVEGAHKL